jgi:hypothetical protein
MNEHRRRCELKAHGAAGASPLKSFRHARSPHRQKLEIFAHRADRRKLCAR